ncbi:hypothetical protein [Streptomyces sp. NPDC051098]|uniref:hypothetical protein n=1 Tax=Streptomyces sp. NPDC051098 TaxID=3155411 RepID=UPI00341ADF9E
MREAVPEVAEQEALPVGETAADGGQLSLLEPADAPLAPDPATGHCPDADAGAEEPAPDTDQSPKRFRATLRCRSAKWTRNQTRKIRRM